MRATTTPDESPRAAAPFTTRVYRVPMLDAPEQLRILYRVYFFGRPVGWQRDDDVAKLNATYAATQATRRTKDAA